MATVRLPTGDRENFRGLGITRTQVSAVVSSGKTRFRPHGNIGFDFFSDGLKAITDDAGKSSVSARHQFMYNAGFEFGAAPS